MIISKSNKYPGVLITKIQDYDDFYMTVSYRKDSDSEWVIPITAFHVLSDDKKTFAEWEVTYGPITTITIFDESHNFDDDKIDKIGGPVINNYFFEKTYGRGNWTQSSVDELELHNLVLNGEYDKLYQILKKMT